MIANTLINGVLQHRKGQIIHDSERQLAVSLGGLHVRLCIQYGYYGFYLTDLRGTSSI